MRKFTVTLLFHCLVLFAFCSVNESLQPFELTKIENGVLMTLQSQQLKVVFQTPTMVRVQYVPKGELKDNETTCCLPQEKQKISVRVKESDDFVTLKTKQLVVIISKSTGAIQYATPNGDILLKENEATPRTMDAVSLSQMKYDDTVENANNKPTATPVDDSDLAWKVRQHFVWQAGEALYGLGSHQEGPMNLRGTMQYIYQHNMKECMPVLMSTKGYGLFFDTGSAMIFHDDARGSYMEMSAVNSLDYYFMAGPEFDQIIAQFRTLTGKVPMLPRYMLGYVQSKERYTCPHDIDSVITRFRTERIPLDVIVQDWSYWVPQWWGHKKFDETIYTNPGGMIKNVHDKHAHYMLSIWPNVNGNEAEEMGAKGYIAGLDVYDAFQEDARKMYWDEYVNKNLFSLDVDAWWCDCSEPHDADWNPQSNPIAHSPELRFQLNGSTLTELLGAKRVNLYSFFHTRGIFENQRKVTEKKRVSILTRSSFAGQQRYGAVVWNGDIKASWNDFPNWIPGGLNFMVTGYPYWTFDAGAFFVRKGVQWFWDGDFERGTRDLGYREFYVRNLQFSQWLIMFRSHGCDTPREPWQFGNPGEPFYESVLSQIKLRYKLLPYTYSLMAKVTRDDYTITRMLSFDFREEERVHDIKDQFMFGPAFMACPVTFPMYYGPESKELTGIDKTRQVYLPGDKPWYDFRTGERYEAGQLLTASAPIEYIPIYVRAGSIVPIGPDVQYADEKKWDSLAIYVYPGADCSFTLYEDEGDNYNYENNAFSTITFNWNDKNKELTIGRREGEYPGMLSSRTFNVVLQEGAPQLQGKIVEYNGKKVKVKL